MARRKVRVGIVGVGNCASSLVQGLAYYAEATQNEPPPGLMNVELGGYHVSDIEIASAFDIHAGKVGRDVSEAILMEPNNTYVFAKPDKAGASDSSTRSFRYLPRPSSVGPRCTCTPALSGLANT